MFKTFKKYRLIGGVIGALVAITTILFIIFLIQKLENMIPVAVVVLPIFLFFFVLPFHVFGMMISTVLGAFGIDQCSRFDIFVFGGGTGFDCTDLIAIFSAIMVILLYFVVGSFIGGFVGLMKIGKKKK